MQNWVVFYIHSNFKVSDRFKCSLLSQVIITQCDSKRIIKNGRNLPNLLYEWNMHYFLWLTWWWPCHIWAPCYGPSLGLSHASDSAQKERHKCFLYTCLN